MPLITSLFTVSSKEQGYPTVNDTQISPQHVLVFFVAEKTLATQVLPAAPI